MADPIEAHYTPDGDDWTIAVTGRGRTLTGRAPGLIAARDRADQLVEELASNEAGHKTVVHMLNGDAVEFTTAYLTARLARTDEPATAPSADTTPDATSPEAETSPEADRSPDAARSPEAENKPAPEQAAQPAKAEQPRVVKPTPSPRTESEAAHPAAGPTPSETPAEHPAPSTN